MIPISPTDVIVKVTDFNVRQQMKTITFVLPFIDEDRPLLVMSPESAEMAKYAANGILATKISFINEVANLCERVKADVHDVRLGIGHDHRIGFQFAATLGDDARHLAIGAFESVEFLVAEHFDPVLLEPVFEEASGLLAEAAAEHHRLEHHNRA